MVVVGGSILWVRVNPVEGSSHRGKAETCGRVDFVEQEYVWSGRFCGAKVHSLAARWQHFFATKNDLGGAPKGLRYP